MQYIGLMDTCMRCAYLIDLEMHILQQSNKYNQQSNKKAFIPHLWGCLHDIPFLHSAVKGHSVRHSLYLLICPMGWSKTFQLVSPSHTRCFYLYKMLQRRVILMKVVPRDCTCLLLINGVSAHYLYICEWLIG